MVLIGMAVRILKLFVDDAVFAAAIVAWMAGVGAVVPLLPHGSQWGAAALFGGLALILVLGALRSAAAGRSA